MPVSDLPTVDYPTINVSASLPGADPNTMSSAVATRARAPVHRHRRPRFDDLAQFHRLHQHQPPVLALDRDIEGAAVDVQSAIAAVTPLLPAGMPAPPSFRKQNPSEQPIIFLSLVSDTLPMSTIDEFAETLIAPRISMINGVARSR